MTNYPVITPEKTIHRKFGYDYKSKCYLIEDFSYLNIPENPNKNDVERARRILMDDLLKELYGLIETKDIQLDLTGKDEKSRKTSLGKKLSNLKDNQIGDYRVTRGKTQRRAQQWKLVPLKS